MELLIQRANILSDRVVAPPLTPWLHEHHPLSRIGLTERYAKARIDELHAEIKAIARKQDEAQIRLVGEAEERGHCRLKRQASDGGYSSSASTVDPESPLSARATPDPWAGERAPQTKKQRRSLSLAQTDEDSAEGGLADYVAAVPDRRAAHRLLARAPLPRS